MKTKTLKEIYEEKTKKSLDFAIEYTLREKENLQNRIIAELDKISKNEEISFQEIINCRRKMKECDEIVAELIKLKSELFEE